MPKANTRYWTIPLTILLFINTVLVAVAARQVGIASDPAAPIGEVAPASQDGPEGEPRVARQEPPVSSIEPAASAAEAIAAGSMAEHSPGEYSTTEDWPTADEPAVVTTGTSEPAPLATAGGGQATEVPSPAGQRGVSRDILVVINPPSTGGVVHFLLDGEVISLAPGELARVLVKGLRLIQFHRGDDFGDEELRMETGVFAFAVSDRGWTLSEAEDHAAARLLQACRPVQPVTAGQADPGDEDDS